MIMANVWIIIYFPLSVSFITLYHICFDNEDYKQYFKQTSGFIHMLYLNNDFTLEIVLKIYNMMGTGSIERKNKQKRNAMHLVAAAAACCRLASELDNSLTICAIFRSGSQISETINWPFVHVIHTMTETNFFFF